MYTPILHGRRSLELQKWLNFRVSVNLLPNVSAFSNSFSSAIAQDGRKGKTFTVSYLVGSLGLTQKLAETISRKVSFEEKGNPDSVLSLFRNHGFTDSQISTIITDYPKVLIADAAKSIGPKLQFLQSRGASASEVSEVLSKVPRVLGIKKNKAISVYYDFVKEIVEADKCSKFEKLCPSSLPQGGHHENILRNVSVLRELGVPQRLLLSLLISDGKPYGGKERFEESLKKVVEMGFDPTTSKFILALRIVQRFSRKAIEEKVIVLNKLGLHVWEMFKKYPPFLCNSEKKITQRFETLKKCGLHEDEILSLFQKFPQSISYSEQKIENSIETLLGLGFSRGDLTMIFKRHPQCIGLTAETVKKKTEFVVKEMNWPLKSVVSTPAVLGYSLEKRTVPRCNVIKALMSKGLLGSELPPLSHVLTCTNEAFLNKYVRKHDNNELVAELMAIFSRRREINK